MGRVKKYAKQGANKVKRMVAARSRANDQEDHDSSDNDMEGDEAKVKKVGAAHGIGKNKVNRKEMRRQMLELKTQQLKLRKNNRHEKIDKKVITKQMADLKKKMRLAGKKDREDSVSSDSECWEEDDRVDPNEKKQSKKKKSKKASKMKIN